jgi:hypothetical protein
MANYVKSARSNYFRVVDRDKFQQWVDSVGGMEVVEDGEGRVALLAGDEFSDEGWPTFIYDKDEDDEIDIDIADELAAHLQEGSVAILMQIGHEKLCCVDGFSVAINSKGETEYISLFDIYERAKWLGDGITQAVY